MVSSVAKRLGESGINESELEAELIISHVLGETIGRVRAMAIVDEDLDQEQLQKVDEIADARCERIPLQHLTGKAPFRTIELDVGPGVFIPRPETEVVTQFAIDELLADASESPIAVDFCTGSGAISLAIVNEVPHARVWALELETNAHAWASRNVERLGLGRVSLLQADATKPTSALNAIVGLATVVISNPPYIPSDAIPIDPEVRDHDPGAALFSGVDGLDTIRGISETAKPLLKPGGLLVLEHAEHQGASVRNILLGAGWNSVSTHQDFTRRDRVTIART